MGSLIQLKTFLKRYTGICIKVGQDTYGNAYYQDRYFLFTSKPYPKRWVIYKGRAEASKVPALWQGWLHYTVNRVPGSHKPFSWQKPSLPNLSGTKYAYMYKNGLQCHKKYYKAWTPE